MAPISRPRSTQADEMETLNNDMAAAGSAGQHKRRNIHPRSIIDRERELTRQSACQTFILKLMRTTTLPVIS
jgi:hypothetical protein